MKRLLSLLGTAVLYASLATMLTQSIFLAALWWKGHLTRERLLDVLAALYGVDYQEIRHQLEEKQKALDAEQPSWQQQRQRFAEVYLDLSVRETALQKALLDLQLIQAKLETEQERFTRLKESFDLRLKELVEDYRSQSLAEVQRTLEALAPDQAKNQLVKMMEQGKLGEVAGIIRRLPADKRRRILAEFKTPEDEQRLFDILTFIGKGEPVASEVEKARQALEGTPPP